MTSILVSAETETWVTDRGEQSNEPYSWQGATAGSIQNVWACVDESDRQYYYGSSCRIDFEETIEAGDTVYAVVVLYTTGSTFHREGGQTQVVDAFLNQEDAQGLLAAINAAGPSEYSIEYGGKDYSCSWAGYFEHKDDAEVWALKVRKSPKDPYEDTHSTGIRYGR